MGGMLYAAKADGLIPDRIDSVHFTALAADSLRRTGHALSSM